MERIGINARKDRNASLHPEQRRLPIGVQIIGPYLEDRTTIDFAALAEREFGGFLAPPGYA